MRSLLTKEQESELGSLGWEQNEYWRKYLPKMYKAKAEDGTLFQSLKERNDWMEQMMQDLMSQGLYENEAREYVNEIMYDLQPEK